METHDKNCELQKNLHSCKCWLRAKGRHKAMESLDKWYLQQHPEDQHGIDPLMDKMNEALHTVDRIQASHETNELRTMNIHEALEKLDALQAQIICGGRPFGDIADAIRAHIAETPMNVTGALCKLGVYLSEAESERLGLILDSQNANVEAPKPMR